MFPQLTHILLDAARMGEQMDTAKTFNKQHESLYRGSKEQTLFSIAPYIFQFSCPTNFSDWFIDMGWGNSWGVLIKSNLPLLEIHKHFRRFLMVNTEDGQQLYFRFYDPRVLRVFLPTCDSIQLRDFFGPIEYFIIEDEDPEFALRFSQQNGMLKRELLKVADIIKRNGPVGAWEIKNPMLDIGTKQPISNSTPETPETPGQNPMVPPAAVGKPIEETKPENSIQKPKSKWNMFD